ncbi:MAG: 2,4-dienoyl-CoA reductase-like NADH-dependent reductase (Old Yellow Enzyme family) [Parasphingorhabdus sp.]|jgi:2,4-dienoyl-CoA reductase-like NADH-dependent reductase (Old Yellow Enzyme family)
MTTNVTFPNLFSQLNIGTVTVKNRIVSTGHDTAMITDGGINDRLIAYHEARARGGAGLIIVQIAGIHDSARLTAHELMAHDDSVIPGFTKLADTVHKHGCKLFVQIFHPGREIMTGDDGSLPVAYAPSVSPAERFHTIPRAMTTEMIEEFVTCYGAAAERMERSGADGVEIVASHGYLPAQFLAEGVNRRTDQYGGTFDNRLRFLSEVISEVRKTTKASFSLGLRISHDEKDSHGLTDDVSMAIIKAVESKIDYVSIVAGSSASTGGAIHIVPPMSKSPGYTTPFCNELKKEINIPVLVAGRINQPQIAEQIIASGKADLCGMTRALIADPLMPQKAQAGHTDDIRACIACNQACIHHFHRGYPISCIQHPETGRELTYGTLIPTNSPKRVLVAGGGPAGMKAAVVAAKRGHQVTLFESEHYLGGQVLLAQLLPGRSEFGGLATNLSREIELAGVEVRLDTTLNADIVSAESADVVIVATGAKPLWPHGLMLENNPHVLDPWQVLRNEEKVGASVVIADWRCDWIGVGLAERLATEGSHVRLAVNGLCAGESLPYYVRDEAAGKLHKLGVEIIPYARLYGADADSVYLQHTASEEAMIQENVDTLILAQGHEPRATLLDELAAVKSLTVIGIGDCVSPRTAEEAVLEGLKAGWGI